MDEFVMWLMGSGAKARIIGYLCTREEQVVNTPHMRRVCSLISGTQYLRVFRELERYGMVQRNSHWQWVVEPHDRWARVRRMVK